MKWGEKRGSGALYAADRGTTKSVMGWSIDTFGAPSPLAASRVAHRSSLHPGSARDHPIGPTPVPRLRVPRYIFSQGAALPSLPTIDAIVESQHDATDLL